ncbi:hypothetical protein AO242_08065 [Pseudomonas sp. ICMP 561]|nr:hypothetical protein AO242_08065 [Pseudomonas sp. ICMP 561]
MYGFLFEMAHDPVGQIYQGRTQPGGHKAHGVTHIAFANEFAPTGSARCRGAGFSREDVGGVR